MKLIPITHNTGHVPVLSCLPTLLQNSITKLENLPCVAGVISGNQEGYATTLVVYFYAAHAMDSKAALQCFNIPGQSIKALSIQKDLHVMTVTVSHSKLILN